MNHYTNRWSLLSYNKIHSNNTSFPQKGEFYPKEEKQVNSLIFITAYIDIYPLNNINQKKNEWRINHFKKLLDTGITIILFISPEYEIYITELMKIYPNLIVEIINIYKELPLFKEYNTIVDLPKKRNPEKDTYNYMALMNSKTEFMIRGMKIVEAKIYAWVDFSINYIFNESNITLSLLGTLPKYEFNERFFYIPGCCKSPGKNPVMDEINWRFCGGFLMGDKQSIIEFHEVITNNLDFLLEPNALESHPKMIWETNFWACLEGNNLWKPTHWVEVNTHNDKMITKIPTELYIRQLKWRCIRPFFINPKMEKLNVIGEYHPSSISYANDETANDEIYICRLINYQLSDDGRYYIYNDGNHLIIENEILFINRTKSIIKLLSYDETTLIPHKRNKVSNGMEDMRIYPDNTFSCNSFSLTKDGKQSQIFYGKIDTIKGEITQIQHIQPPLGILQCEKNWLWLPPISNGKKNVIYSWNPYNLGNVIDNKLMIHTNMKLEPAYLFQNARGSTSFIDYQITNKNCQYNGDWLIGVIHYSIDQPWEESVIRKYYHLMVLLDKTKNIPRWISKPFLFGDTHGIEFCIGLKYDHDLFHFFVSIMDKDPVIFTIEKEKIEFDFPVVEMISPL